MYGIPAGDKNHFSQGPWSRILFMEVDTFALTTNTNQI